VLVARVIPEALTVEHLESTLDGKATLTFDLSQTSSHEGDLLVFAHSEKATAVREVVRSEAKAFGFLVRPTPGPAAELFFKLRHTTDAFRLVDPHSGAVPFPRDVEAALDAVPFRPATVAIARRQFRGKDGALRTATLVMFGQVEDVPWVYIVWDGRVLAYDIAL
jgi:hypothetical protein